jgi:hypothetical protein
VARVWSRVELIVGLYFPRWLSLSRLLRRCVVRVVRRTPVWNGNVETWRALFAGVSPCRSKVFPEESVQRVAEALPDRWEARTVALGR